MRSVKDYRIQLNRIKNLPSLPAASVRIIDAVNDPEISVDKLVEVLSLSPPLVARLLGLANSAYFGYSGRINDLRKAIIRVLGLKLVKSLSLSIALNVQLDGKKCPYFDADYYWLDALMTAVLAQKLSTKCQGDFGSQSIVYTSGLLLNIGILVAVFLFPDDMQEILKHCEITDHSLKKGIIENIGLSHYRLGYQLLNKWHLPVIYQTVMKEFSNPAYAGNERALIILQHLSQTISSDIIKGKPIDLEKYDPWLDSLSLPKTHLNTVVEQVMARKNDILELATIISG